MAAEQNWSALGQPVYAAPLRIVFPIFDADGDLVTGAAGLDSEISKDGGSFADCTNEATEIGSTGFYYLDLTGTEMTAYCVAVQVKTSTSGAKTTPIVLTTRRLVEIRAATAQDGAEGSITLDSSAASLDDYYNGCLVQLTNNDPAGVQGATRLITDYVGSTKVASIAPNWATNPTSSSTFKILVPETAALVAWAGTAVLQPATAGTPLTNVSDKTGFALTAAYDAAKTAASAQQVWEYATRSLTTFGSLVSDIATAVWSAADRSLTSFGTLASQIWTHEPRTLTGGATPTGGELASLDDVKAYLGLSGEEHDALLTTLLGRAGAAIEDHCRCTFAPTEQVELHDGRGTASLVLRRRPILSVTTVHEDAAREFGDAAEVPSGDYVVRSGEGMIELTGGAVFARGSLTVRVDYVAGYETVPAPVAPSA